MTAALYPIINGSTADTDGYFEISGNFTATFSPLVTGGSPPLPLLPGFPFVAIDSNGSPATVQSAIATTVFSSTFTGTTTQIVPDDGTGSALTIPAPNGTYVTLAGGAYSLSRSNPLNPPVIITPGGADATQTSLALPGRATLNYGVAVNTSLVRLLEHFANPIAPSTPLEGQIWYDTSDTLNKVARIYNDSTATWELLTAGFSLGDLVDVDSSTSYGSPGPTVGDVLTWNGSEWINAPSSAFSGVNYFELIAAGGESVINVSPVNTQSKTATTAYQRVYLNGVLLREGAGGGYTVTGANQITLLAPYSPLVALDEIIVYED